jgi:hypothetical protein
MLILFIYLFFLLGKDVLAKAKTGTGKTVAFLVRSFNFVSAWVHVGLLIKSEHPSISRALYYPKVCKSCPCICIVNIIKAFFLKNDLIKY